VFGHIGDYSGIVGTLTRGGTTMVQVVASHINANGGLNGHPVQVVVADAGGDPARALSLVRDMVETKGAVAFLGNIWILSAGGAREYLEQRKIPVIGGDGLLAVWFESPMYFPTSLSMPYFSLGALGQLVALNKKKIAVTYCAETQVCKVWHDVAVANAQKMGAEIVYEVQVSLAQPDFTAECIQAQRRGADGVMSGVDGPSTSRFARACAQQGYRPQYTSASLAIIESIAKDPNLDGMRAVVGNFPYMADDLPAVREYQATLKKYAPTLESSPTTATVWTAGALLRKVGAQLPPGAVGPADFFPGLYTIKNDTLGGLVGPLTYNDAKPASEVRCVFSIKVEGGRFIAPNGSQQACL
jgi:branched-chain amino acid transport system substrate-binding protein